MSTTVNRDVMRAANRTAVLNALRLHGPQSQAGLATTCRLSQAAVSEIAAELVRDGFVNKAGSRPSGARGGRPGTVLALAPHGRVAVGAKVLDDAVVTVVVGLDGSLLSSRTDPLPAAGSVTPEQFADLLCLLLVEVCADAPGPVLGIGVGVTGQVDSAGVVTGSRLFPQSPQVPLGALLAQRLLHPVHLENDVTTLVVAEQWFGVGRGVRSFVVATVGRGIGAGLVLDGRLHRGVGGAAGELGHLVVDPQGSLCECGNRGCLETVAADPALARLADGAAPDDHLLGSSGERIGQAIAWLVTLTAPELVVLTGEGLTPDGARLAGIRAGLDQSLFPPLRDRVRVVHEPMAFTAWARGAACLVLGVAFTPPTDLADGTPVLAPLPDPIP
ncbi:ROK family protein [Aestuariimicrobium soli]|uniref:ROK family protein n=1 Tax=Aestuariimicrobium soli TaxID=2035834 RepID=UPI003EBC17D1